MSKVQILVGDAITRLKELKDNSVHCVMTSPPYWQLRNYGVADAIGLEPTFEEHLDNLVKVFTEVHRVLRDDGIIFINYGDAYCGASKGGGGEGLQRTNVGTRQRYSATIDGLPAKSLLMMPARVALALQENGWILRSEIIFGKTNPMPESTTDRPTSAHEKLFMFSKEPRYFYDYIAVRTQFKDSSIARLTQETFDQQAGGPKDTKTGNRKRKRFPTAKINGIRNREKWDASDAGELGANLRNIWMLPLQGFSMAHFAVFPEALVTPPIKAGTSERGCCAKCGTPWRRVVLPSKTSGKSWHDHSDDMGKGQSQRKGTGYLKWVPSKGAGWQPACECWDEEYKKFPKPRKMRKKLQRLSWDGWWKRVRARPGLDSWPTVPCVVLDPFGGAGTVGLVASKLGRNSILIEINPEYAELAKDRIVGEIGEMFCEVEVK